MKARRVEKRLVELGFELLPNRGKGSHRIFRHPDGRFVVLSDQHGLIPKGTLAAIRRAIRPDELR